MYLISWLYNSLLTFIKSIVYVSLPCLWVGDLETAGIGEYSAKKSIFSPAGKNIVKKFPHIFHLKKWKIV